MEKTTNPGYGPVFEYIDDPKDPDNGEKLADAQRFRRENPNGLIMHWIIVDPPDGEPNWERYIASGTNIQIVKAQALAQEKFDHTWQNDQTAPDRK
jgi:hypothetical protein